jgi:hypothetical protein
MGSQEMFGNEILQISASWIARTTVLSHPARVRHFNMLMALVQSVIRRIPNSSIPPERIHGRTCGYKESLLKVREKKYKVKHDGAQVEAGNQESVFLPLRCF